MSEPTNREILDAIDDLRRDLGGRMDHLEHEMAGLKSDMAGLKHTVNQHGHILRQHGMLLRGIAKAVCKDDVEWAEAHG